MLPQGGQKFSKNVQRDKNASFLNIISKLYLALQNLKSDHTFKVRREAEGGLTVSQEEWDRICKQKLTMTNSPSWREFSWKNVIQFFSILAQKTNYSNQTACQRSCGNTLANHYHIFWGCPSVALFWKDGHRVQEAALKNKMYLNFKILTRKWLKKEKPTINEWIDIIYNT